MSLLSYCEKFPTALPKWRPAETVNVQVVDTFSSQQSESTRKWCVREDEDKKVRNERRSCKTEPYETVVVSTEGIVFGMEEMRKVISDQRRGENKLQ